MQAVATVSPPVVMGYFMWVAYQAKRLGVQVQRRMRSKWRARRVASWGEDGCTHTAAAPHRLLIIRRHPTPCLGRYCHHHPHIAAAVTATAATATATATTLAATAAAAKEHSQQATHHWRQGLARR